MAVYAINDTTLTAIADSIRAKKGTVDPIKPEDMAAEIASIEGGGSPEPDPRDQYQRVEYINTDGAAYVVTDIFADNTCGMEMVASFPTVADRACMGSRQDSNNTRFFTPYPLSLSSTYFGFNGAIKISASINTNKAYRWQTNFVNSRLASVCDMDGINKGSTVISGTLAPHTAPIYIFATVRCETGNASSVRKLSLYSARISQGTDVVREYIPCYRKSDGVAGLFEKITGQFLENAAGVGSFAVGADIDWEDSL